MPGRRITLTIILSAAVALSGAAAAGADDVEPYAVCGDGECDIVDGLSREELELTAGDAYELLFVADADPPGDVVCLEGIRGCVVRDPGFSIADAELVHDGRVVHGVVDADPTGAWAAVNLPSRMRCMPVGSKPISVKVKRTTDSGTISWDGDGLMGQSHRAGEPSYALVRMGPGVYAAIVPFTEAGAKGQMVSYFGMLSEDEIAGTSIIRTTVKRGGTTVTCRMNRNFDMTRTSGPQARPPGDDPAEQASDPSDATGSGGEGPAMVFDEDEVEPIGGEGPAMVFDEDEVEPIGGEGPAMVFDEDEVDEGDE